jgi:hypothetical protein
MTIKQKASSYNLQSQEFKEGDLHLAKRAALLGSVSAQAQHFSSETVDAAEPLYVIKDAAKLLHLPIWKLSRAVRAGIVPSYRFLNGRRLVRITEVLAVVERSREGGAK